LHVRQLVEVVLQLKQFESQAVQKNSVAFPLLKNPVVGQVVKHELLVVCKYLFVPEK
jgi:hypothetical protein